MLYLRLYTHEAVHLLEQGRASALATLFGQKKTAPTPITGSHPQLGGKDASGKRQGGVQPSMSRKPSKSNIIVKNIKE
jgi:hypothetical protein